MGLLFLHFGTVLTIAKLPTGSQKNLVIFPLTSSLFQAHVHQQLLNK